MKTHDSQNAQSVNLNDMIRSLDSAAKQVLAVSNACVKAQLLNDKTNATIARLATRLTNIAKKWDPDRAALRERERTERRVERLTKKIATLKASIAA
jgi:uncharacterized coiled-coil DUF342 family protein